MFASTVFVAATLLGGAAAQGGAVNHLETARLTQAAQRAEFGVEGDASAFKFKFSDPVCFIDGRLPCAFSGAWLPDQQT
jgi:hypothetical protein